MKELPIGTEIKLPFATLKVEEIDSSDCSQFHRLELSEKG